MCHPASIHPGDGGISSEHGRRSWTTTETKTEILDGTGCEENNTGVNTYTDLHLCRGPEAVTRQHYYTFISVLVTIVGGYLADAREAG